MQNLEALEDILGTVLQDHPKVGALQGSGTWPMDLYGKPNIDVGNLSFCLAPFVKTLASVKARKFEWWIWGIQDPQ